MLPPAHRRRRRAYSLVELVAVMALVATLAVAAAPALRWMDRSRDAALEHEVRRLLALARATVIATGAPAGVRFDTTAQTLWLVVIPAPGEAPAPGVDATGNPAAPVIINALYPGASIISMTNGDGLSTRDTIWFGYAGAPEVRQGSGALIGPFTQDAVVTLSGGRSVTIRRATGMIE